MLSRFLLSTTALSTLIMVPALAADLPGREAPIAPAPLPVFTWTGAYVGLHAGAAFINSSYVSPGPFSYPDPRSSITKAGIIGGVQIGYNWQINSMVAGLEADISLSSAKGSTLTQPFVNSPYSAKMSAFGTLRARVGFTVDRALIYATGGLAYAQYKSTLNDVIFPFTVSSGSSKFGWTLGAGFEYAVTNNWSVKAEYLYMQFPNKNVVSNPVGYAFTFKEKASIARAGVNYRF